jgi:membrane dipeptidase
MKRIILFTILLNISNIVFSQTPNFYGTIKDKVTGSTIESVTVEVVDQTDGSKYITQTNSSGYWSLTTSAVNTTKDLPQGFSLDQNYPNPFNPSTKIGFSINKEGAVNLRVFNILGQELDHRSFHLSPGVYSIDWYSKGASAVLFYTIEFGGMKLSKKMIQVDGGRGGFGTLTFLGDAQNNIQSSVNLNKTNTHTYMVYFSLLGYVSDSVTVSGDNTSSIDINLETVHHSAMVIDLHNDLIEHSIGEDYDWSTKHTTNTKQTDIPRLIEGGIDVQFFAVWVSTDGGSNFYTTGLAMINYFNQQISDDTAKIIQARTESEIDSLNALGKIAAIIGVEGGHTIENSIDKLINLYNLGMRYLTITWNNSTDWAVSSADSRTKTVGLSDFGKQVIKTLDSLGVIIDVAHTGIKTIEDILVTTTNPIVSTHTGVYSLANNARNLTDDQIKAIADGGGVVGIVFYPYFLTNTSTAYISDIIKHIDYIVNLVGIDYVALGSDFDGIGTTVPQDLKNVSQYPALTLALLKKGYSVSDVKKILGENFMRVFRKVCKK